MTAPATAPDASKPVDPRAAEPNVLYHPFTREFWLGATDLRPLGIIRILLGLVVLWDIFRRSEELVAWHTDLGVLPRQALVEGIARPWRLSLLDMMGTPGMVTTFFVVGTLAAFCVTIGFKTRLATVLTWMFVVSVQERNLGVTDSSDTLFRVLLFWMMFAPAGAAYSLDRALARLRQGGAELVWPPRGSAVGLRFMQAEVVILYFVTSVTKGGEHWRDGTAVYRAMQVWDFARPTADFVVSYLGFLSRPMAYGALVVEFSMACLLWFPNVRARQAALAVGTAFHVLGIELTLNVGMFSLMMPICYSMFLWSGACDVVDRNLPSFPGVVAWAQRKGFGLLSDVPEPGWVGRPINARVFGILAVMMGTIVWDQVHEVNKLVPRPPEPLVAVMESLSLWQNWRMFAPNPVFDSGPWTAEGTLQDGSKVDVLAVAMPGFATPPPGRFIYTRWNKYRLHIRQNDQRGYLLWLGKHICRQFNRGRRDGQLLDNYELVYHLRRTHAPDEPAAPEQLLTMWKHYCIKVPDGVK